jgi:glycosyltransferase involved in cell wall biosynthesis
MLGEQSSTERIYPALDIYCSPSLNEGFPNALSEAMACGVPCVATDTGASRELVEGHGVVVPPRSVEDLAAGIEKLAILSAAQRSELGEQARELIYSKFSLDRVLRRYSDLYGEVASSARSSRPTQIFG